jgi:hypothetical protein
MKKITEQEKRKILFQTPYTVSYDLDTLQRLDSLVTVWEKYFSYFGNWSNHIRCLDSTLN